MMMRSVIIRGHRHIQGDAKRAQLKETGSTRRCLEQCWWHVFSSSKNTINLLFYFGIFCLHYIYSNHGCHGYLEKIHIFKLCIPTGEIGRVVSKGMRRNNTSWKNMWEVKCCPRTGWSSLAAFSVELSCYLWSCYYLYMKIILSWENTDWLFLSKT